MISYSIPQSTKLTRSDEILREDDFTFNNMEPMDSQVGIKITILESVENAREDIARPIVEVTRPSDRAIEVESQQLCSSVRQ